MFIINALTQSVQWVGYGLGDGGWIPGGGLGRDVLVSATAYRAALGPMQPAIQGVPGAFTPRKKRTGCTSKADHLSPPSADVMNARSYTSTPPVRLHGVVLSQETDATL